MSIWLAPGEAVSEIVADPKECSVKRQAASCRAQNEDLGFSIFMSHTPPPHPHFPPCDLELVFLSLARKKARSRSSP